MDFGAISTGQMMQLWSIAAREGPVWNLLLKIIVGDVVAPQALKANTSRKTAKRGVVKAVNSAANFVNIGGIDDDILVSLLNEVVVGHASLQRLNEKCALVKARMKVQTAILQDRAIDADDWAVAKASFPVACDEHFVERWACSLAREGVKARAALPDLFFVEVDRRISADKSSAASRGHAAVSVHPLILMRCENHFQYHCFSLILCPHRHWARMKSPFRALCMSKKSQSSVTMFCKWRSFSNNLRGAMVNCSRAPLTSL